MNNGKKINSLLKERYDLDLMSGEIVSDHLIDIALHYEDKREFLKSTLHETEIVTSEQYAKAYLISEAARMILREIAPKRTKKRKEKR